MEADDINGVEAAVYPDGLTAEVIEGLLSEARPFWATPTRSTSALLDGTAAERRERRIARREMGAVVRTLPARLPRVMSDSVQSGEVA